MSAFRINLKHVVLAALLAALPAAAIAQSAPIRLTPAVPDAETPVVISAPPVTYTPAAAASLAPQPVEASPLGDIKPDPVAPISNNDDTLGAGMWKGTSYHLAERLMAQLVLPSPLASMNDLADRFLATMATPPEGAGTGQNLNAIRATKLLELGNAAAAWKLATLADSQIDDAGLRRIAEAALISPAAADVCAAMPDIIRKRNGIEWQKLMAVCQFLAKDSKAAQVSLDLLQAQDAHDEVFFAVAEKNLIGGSRQLPKQLLPLHPLTLALLQLTGLPLPGELYAHPEAPLIPALLKTRSEDEAARLGLAERTAARGLIGPQDLAAIYDSVSYSPDSLYNNNINGQQGPLLRAMLYQASQEEKNPQNRVNETVKYFQSLDAALAGGSVAKLMGTMMGGAQPATALAPLSATVAHIDLMAGDAGNAVPWLDFARATAAASPTVAAEFHTLWPLAAMSGLEADKNFSADLDQWLAASLATSAAPAADAEQRKHVAAAILALLDAIGFPVGDDAWAKCTGSAAYEKEVVPQVFISERLYSAAGKNRKGETVLLALLAMSGGEAPALRGAIESVRALRLVGLNSEAASAAREAISLVPQAKAP